MELVIYTTKIRMTHAPFKGAADALAETLAGRTLVGKEIAKISGAKLD